MTDTANLGLPLIEAAQAQKHVTHNEALHILDTLIQLAVVDRDLAAPPGAPLEGERWIVAAAPTGAWIGHAGHIAFFAEGDWQFCAPQRGWLVYVIDEGALVAWSGSAWIDAISALTSLNNMTQLGVGTAADGTNPFSAKLNNALWVAKTIAEGGDGNLRYKMSKEAAGNTLSLLLQDNFSGRAEIGLTGDDDLHVKVSGDGTTWIDALRVSGATGGLCFQADEMSVGSAATCDIGAATSLKVLVTGTTTVTSFGAQPYGFKFVRFANVLTLTHNATSLILPGAADITTVAGDTAIFASDGSADWRCLAYYRASGLPVAARAPSVVTYTSSATWSKASYPGMTALQVEVWGGGGSGGGAASSASQVSLGSGGGGGGYSSKRIAAAALGATETVTVGAGGAAPAAGNNNGNAGSASSFGAHCSASGGIGGIASGSAPSNGVIGGVAGAGSGGDVNLRGGPGGTSNGAFTPPMLLGGWGGDGAKGGGGGRSNAGGLPGENGGAFGGGGSGGNSYGGSGSTAGGAGGAGAVVVTVFYS